MSKPPNESCSDKTANFDHEVTSFAKEIYEKSDASVSHLLSKKHVDEICPLYASMQRIDERYQSPELVGQGGMKEVYRVYDAKLVRHVALAKPLQNLSLDYYDAFLREAHVTARLEHPGIINLFNIGIDENGRPFFTMEFKRGSSLRQHLRYLKKNGGAKKSPEHERLAIFLRVCEAIAYAHSRRVLHLDIKPGNIQLGEFGEVQVCDWGMGVVIRDEDQTDKSTALLDPDLYGPLLARAEGTPAYMAPEQRDRLQPKTQQMDIYALGCVLFEIVTLEKYRNENSLTKVGSTLAAILRKALAKDPSQRYESVDSLYRDMSRYNSHLSTSVEKPNLFREAKLFWKRHREVCLVVLSASLLVGGLLCLFIFQLSNKEKAAVSARKEAEQASDLYREQVNEAKRLLDNLEFARIKTEAFRSQDHAMLTGENFSSTVHESIRSYTKLTEKGAPPDSNLWEYRIWWHFLAQDFESARKIANHSSRVATDLINTADRYAPLLNESGYLETDDFICLLSDTQKRKSLCARMLIYDLENHPRPIVERTQIIRRWVDLKNGGTGAIELRYDEKSKSVELRGPVKSLCDHVKLEKNQVVSLNFLQSLDPVSIDIRETEIQSLRQLEGLKPIEIDLRNTPVSSLAPLKNFRSLQRIIVTESQFSPKQLRQVATWTEVISSRSGISKTTASPP